MEKISRGSFESYSRFLTALPISQICWCTAKIPSSGFISHFPCWPNRWFFALFTQVDFFSLYERERISLDCDALFSVLKLEAYLCQRCYLKNCQSKTFYAFPEASVVPRGENSNCFSRILTDFLQVTLYPTSLLTKIAHSEFLECWNRELFSFSLNCNCC